MEGTLLDPWFGALTDEELRVVLAQFDERELTEIITGVPAEFQASLEHAYTTFGIVSGLRRSADELREQAEKQLRDPKGMFREMRARIAQKVSEKRDQIGAALKKLPGVGERDGKPDIPVHDIEAWKSWRAAEIAKTRDFSKGRVDGTGEIDDPIDVEGDIPRAAELISQGKHVRLNSEMEVSTLLDELAKVPRDSKENYDLCKVSVPGTNLFCAESKGIPRIKMPQVEGAPEPGSPAEKYIDPRSKYGNANLMNEFRNNLLAGMGVGVDDRDVPAEMLRASQNELKGANVAGIRRKMEKDQAAGIVDTKPGIFVTRDGYVIDGHHRWAATVGFNFDPDNKDKEIPVKTQMLDMGVTEALDLTNAYVNMMGVRPQAAGAGADTRTAAQRMADGEADLRRMITARTGMKGAELDKFIKRLKDGLPQG